MGWRKYTIQSPSLQMRIVRRILKRRLLIRGIGERVLQDNALLLRGGGGHPLARIGRDAYHACRSLRSDGFRPGIKARKCEKTGRNVRYVPYDVLVVERRG